MAQCSVRRGRGGVRVSTGARVGTAHPSLSGKFSLNRTEVDACRHPGDRADPAPQ